MNVGDQSIGKWISILYRYGHSYIGKELKPYHIGSGQYIFLLSLFKKDGISQEELSDHLNIDKGTTARAIKKLEEAGYVKRQVDQLDKRAYRIYITQQALEIMPVIFETLSSWTDVLVSSFTKEQQQNMLMLLKEMAQNVALYEKKLKNNKRSDLIEQPK